MWNCVFTPDPTKINRLEQHYALVYKCLQNDRKAQNELYETFARKMYSVCLRYTSDRDAATDILQEAFVKVFQSMEKFSFEGSVEGWIRRIVVNTAIDHFRKAAKMYVVQDLEDAQIEDSSANHFLGRMASEDIIACMQQLPAGYRTVINLYIIEEFSHKEIAKMLGISEGTSKSQLARAKAHLKVLLDKIERNINHEASGII